MHFNLSFKQNLHRILVKLETENENLDVKIFITPAKELNLLLCLY